MSENTCEGAPAVIHVVGFVTASSVGGFDWFWHRGAAEAMRKRHLDQGVPEVTEVREIRLDKLPLDGNHGRDAITNALDDYPELWEPRTSAEAKLAAEGIDPASMTEAEIAAAYPPERVSDIDNAIACGATTRNLCPDCIDAYKNGIEPGESACETGDHDPPSADARPDIRNAKAWLMGISDSLKQAERDPSGLDEGSIGLADMAATIDDIVERVDLGAQQTLDRIFSSVEDDDEPFRDVLQRAGLVDSNGDYTI